MKIAWIFAQQILSKNLESYSEVAFSSSYFNTEIIPTIMMALLQV